jgi:hypothetical protein
LRFTHLPLFNLLFMHMLEYMVIIHWWPFKMLKQPFPCYEGCEHLRICCISHQLSNSYMKLSSSMVPIALEYWWGPLVAP